MMTATAHRVLMRDYAAEHQIRLSFNGAQGKIYASCNCGDKLTDPRSILPAEEALEIYRQHLEDVGALPPHPAPTTPPAGETAEGALSTATDHEESRAMNHTIDLPHAETRQGRQLAAALVIAKMCEHQLPDISHWMIRHDLTISGMITSALDDPFAALCEWAVFIARDDDAPPRPKLTTPKHGIRPSRVSVAAAYRGVPVEIWYDATERQLAAIPAASVTPGGE
jgi:hypothetical protein